MRRKALALYWPPSKPFPVPGIVGIIAILILLASSIFAAESGTIKGTVRAVAASGADSQVTYIADAKLTLINKASPDAPFRTLSNTLGEFIFEDLPSGDYTLTAKANGLTKSTKDIKLEPGALLLLDIDLSATVNESVTIREEEGLLSTSDPSTSNIVRTETLKNQPLRSDSFQNAIQLTPGTVRDGFGNDYLKGTRTGQSGYTVNGADVTDPVSGNLAFNLPLEAANSLQIEENPYSASFGRFTGAVTNLQTKGGGDKFKVSAARFFPTFHNVFTSKIDTFRPRLTLSGAIVPGKLFYLQSFEYRFSRVYATNQPPPDNTTVQEGVNSFSQIDWNINKSNVLKINAALFPIKYRNLGLDVFNPASATPDFKQRGMLFSVSGQSVFKAASFLSSEISYKTFDIDVYAKSVKPYNVAPEANSGGYFADTRRQSKRIQWQETYYARPLEFHGTHSLKTSFEFFQTRIAGQLRYSSIFIRRVDNTLAQRIDFTNSAPLDYKYTEAGFFVQDRWVVNPKLTLDYGVRLDRDGIVKRSNPAPRFSFLFQPSNNTRTTIRGGIGVFYDRSLAFVGFVDRGTAAGAIIPDQAPGRVVTNFASNGTTVIDGPRFFDLRKDTDLRTPRSVRWSIQLDRGITKTITARFGFMRRNTKNDMLIDQSIGPGNTGTHLLNTRGGSTYIEFQSLLAYSNEKKGHWNAFYVFSRARGDLNTADKFFADTPNLVVRPNEYGRLPFDAPHRIMFYGQIDVFKKLDIRLAPLFEIRSGFPISKLNERLDYIGGRNAAGRLPLYVSIDLQVTKGIKLPFINKRARIGAAIFNITNHFNPRDVQMNLTSPNYGRFYNSLKTTFKGKFDLDF